MHHAECDAPKCECDEWDKKLPPTRGTIVVWLPQINRAENSEQNSFRPFSRVQCNSNRAMRNRDDGTLATFAAPQPVGAQISKRSLIKLQTKNKPAIGQRMNEHTSHLVSTRLTCTRIRSFRSFIILQCDKLKKSLQSSKR
jgi:hypothetical protein